MHVVGQVEGLQFGTCNPLLNCELVLIFLKFPGSNAEHSLLFEQFETLLKMSGQVALPSRGLRDDLESLAIGSYSE